ncbi:MAG TPA: FAD-binding oxidoreductase [Candidatus Saccharimonadales bacterium]|nr:FAD-binding oxidoreductase [Candidatus Saccharimonadales bacterium]
MDQKLLEELKQKVTGDVLTDETTLKTYSHDASLFEVKPQVVVCPKTDEDVVSLVKFVSSQKKEHPHLSLTGRSAGTDMGGGSINDSILVSFTQYFNQTPVVHGNTVTTQPGVYYRDFEKETLKHNLIFPSYPASREICALGGIVNNNSGGEKSLQYGKTEKYVKRVKVVLRDGSIVEFMPLSEKELEEKMKLKTVEGEIYRNMFDLISKNYDLLQEAKPKVTKNSAGYYLWNVWDKEKKIFDLTKLWVGAQGTLGLLLEAEIELVPVKKHHEMEVIYLHDLSHLGQIIDAVMPLKPESFESYDDNTLILALKYFPEFIHQLGLLGLIQAGLAFLPAFLDMLVGRLPKLILQVDFAGDDPDKLKEKIATLRARLKPLHPQTTIAMDNQEKKYWLVRRESFNLLRHKVRNRHTAPFIDDIIVDSHDFAEVFTQVSNILKKHHDFIFAGQGHVGDGNFHIIPLVDIKKKSVRDAIPVIANQVYSIVISHHGSITGEHNDGLIRSPYLKEMYGEKVCELFKRTKEIFDPQDIFNPRKKVGATLAYAMDHIRTQW